MSRRGVPSPLVLQFSWIYFARPFTPPVGTGMVLVFGSIVWRACHSHRKHGPKAEVVDAKNDVETKALIGPGPQGAVAPVATQRR